MPPPAEDSLLYTSLCTVPEELSLQLCAKFDREWAQSPAKLGLQDLCLSALWIWRPLRCQDAKPDCQGIYTEQLLASLDILAGNKLCCLSRYGPLHIKRYAEDGIIFTKSQKGVIAKHKEAFSVHEADGFVNPWDYFQTEHGGIHGGQSSMEQHFRRVEIRTALAIFSSQLCGKGAFSLGTAALLIRDVSVRFRYSSSYGCTKEKLSLECASL